MNCAGPLLEQLRCHRPLEQIALSQATPLLQEKLALLLSLHPFGNDLQLQTDSQCNNRPGDGHVIGIIRDIPDGRSDMAITRAVIALGRGLDMRVIAEGVERNEQRRFLHTEACDEAQGFLYTRPLPARELERLMKESSLPGLVT